MSVYQAKRRGQLDRIYEAGEIIPGSVVPEQMKITKNSWLKKVVKSKETIDEVVAMASAAEKARVVAAAEVSLASEGYSTAVDILSEASSNVDIDDSDFNKKARKEAEASLKVANRSKTKVDKVLVKADKAAKAAKDKLVAALASDSSRVDEVVDFSAVAEKAIADKIEVESMFLTESPSGAGPEAL